MKLMRLDLPARDRAEPPSDISAQSLWRARFDLEPATSSAGSGSKILSRSLPSWCVFMSACLDGRQEGGCLLAPAGLLRLKDMLEQSFGLQNERLRAKFPQVVGANRLIWKPQSTGMRNSGPGELKSLANRYIVVTLRDLAAPGLPSPSPPICLITRAQHVCIQHPK